MTLTQNYTIAPLDKDFGEVKQILLPLQVYLQLRQEAAKKGSSRYDMKHIVHYIKAGVDLPTPQSLENLRIDFNVTRESLQDAIAWKVRLPSNVAQKLSERASELRIPQSTLACYYIGLFHYISGGYEA